LLITQNLGIRRHWGITSSCGECAGGTIDIDGGYDRVAGRRRERAHEVRILRDMEDLRVLERHRRAAIEAKDRHAHQPTSWELQGRPAECGVIAGLVRCSVRGAAVARRAVRERLPKAAAASRAVAGGPLRLRRQALAHHAVLHVAARLKHTNLKCHGGVSLHVDLSKPAVDAIERAVKRSVRRGRHEDEVEACGRCRARQRRDAHIRVPDGRWPPCIGTLPTKIAVYELPVEEVELKRLADARLQRWGRARRVIWWRRRDWWW